MASSAFYKQQAEKYEAIKGQVSALSGSAQGLLDGIVSAKPYISELIIGYDTIDKGKLDTLSTALDACIAAINAVVVECQTKIDEYMALYKRALIAERNAYARKKQDMLLSINAIE